MIDRVLVRDFRTSDTVSSITSLLHAAYALLARQGYRYTATHQDDATTFHRLQSGFAFVAELDGAIVGTITLRPPQPTSPCAWYARPGVYSFGQFGVLPSLQGRGLGSRLLGVVERRARELGAEALALDTAEGAIQLRRWYERLGFRFIEHVSWPDTNYRSVVLSRPCTVAA